MVISSKGRYALRVMVDLAEHGGDGYVSMRDVARRQEISDKYAGQIMTPAESGGTGGRRHRQGRRLSPTRQPEEYPLGEILRLTEGSLAPVACMGGGGPTLRPGLPLPDPAGVEPPGSAHRRLSGQRDPAGPSDPPGIPRGAGPCLTQRSGAYAILDENPAAT